MIIYCLRTAMMSVAAEPAFALFNDGEARQSVEPEPTTHAGWKRKRSAFTVTFSNGFFIR